MELNNLSDTDAVQNHFSMLVAFTAMERDLLIKHNLKDPKVKERLKYIDFVIDEYAIKVLERHSPYEC